MKRKLIALGAIATLSLGLAGCGGAAGGGGDEAKVIAVVEGVFNDMVNGKAGNICDHIMGGDSKPLKADKTSYDQCKSMYDTMGETMKEEAAKQGIKDVKISKATVDGDTATIAAKDVSGAGDLGPTGSDLKLTKVDGEWYMDMSAPSAP